MVKDQFSKAFWTLHWKPGVIPIEDGAHLWQGGMQAPQEAGNLAGCCGDAAHLTVGQCCAPGEALEGGEEDPAPPGGEDIRLRLAHGCEFLTSCQPGVHLRQRLQPTLPSAIAAKRLVPSLMVTSISFMLQPIAKRKGGIIQ